MTLNTKSHPHLEVTSDRSAVHRRAVVFCCYGSYVPYAALAAVRIAALHPQRSFDICLCSGEVPLELPASLASADLRICRFRTGDLFQGLRLDRGATSDVYLRLALPAAFASDYDRILYLDADLFVQGGDFEALLDLDLGGRALGAVRDNTQWRTPKRHASQFRQLGLPAAPYFNAGVLLMDVATYNASDLLGHCLRLGRQEAGRMTRHDQNLYNAVLRGDWAEISPLWNWQYTWASRFFEAMQEAHIVHFIGSRKPWKDPDGQLPPRFARAMAEFIALHWPERATPPVGLGPALDARLMRKHLWKHWLGASAMARYLARFPTDLTVRVPAGSDR
jgi:lipopolysaccharide biosynthesis glycosyltransferase